VADEQGWRPEQLARGKSAVPPEVLRAGRVVLRHQRVEDAQGIAAAVADSLPELRPWMPWATDESSNVAFQKRRLEQDAVDWDEGPDFPYVIIDQDVVIGCMGLHARVGPGALEIGYWLRTSHTGRGIVTGCVQVLTTSALTLPGIHRVEIHCDEANLRSAAIPRRVGYRLDRVKDDEPTAPAVTGHTMIWVFPP
jgi:RimJ/RimL family protein N-acetyltransferase